MSLTVESMSLGLPETLIGAHRSPNDHLTSELPYINPRAVPNPLNRSPTIDNRNHHLGRFLIRSPIWGFPTIRGPNIDPKIIGLVSQGHQRHGPPIYRNSHIEIIGSLPNNRVWAVEGKPFKGDGAPRDPKAQRDPSTCGLRGQIPKCYKVSAPNQNYDSC